MTKLETIIAVASALIGIISFALGLIEFDEERKVRDGVGELLNRSPK